MRSVILSVLIVFACSPVIAGEVVYSEQEQAIIDQLVGAWVENKDKSLEQIYRKLEEEELDRETNRRLHFARRLTEESDIVMTFSADGRVTLEGSMGNEEIDQTSKLRVLEVEDDKARVNFEGIEGERVLSLENGGFTLCCDIGITRYYIRH